LILLSIWGTLEVLPDLVPLQAGVGRFAPTPSGDGESGQSSRGQALHELTDTVCTAKATQTCCSRPWLACVYCQHGFGSSDRVHSFTAGFGSLREGSFFLLCQRSQGMLLGRGHDVSSSLTSLSLIFSFIGSPFAFEGKADCGVTH
jgi:hypothetical protein